MLLHCFQCWSNIWEAKWWWWWWWWCRHSMEM